jgi:gamma-glutamyl:cysteine ligase YbdK (ATP-grasp superfamily)
LEKREEVCRFQVQNITTKDRYDIIVNDMGDVARSNLIFGLHVHVGVPNREEGIRIQNIARYFLPHIYALSTSSPFWEGRNTGFKSFRQKIPRNILNSNTFFSVRNANVNVQTENKIRTCYISHIIYNNVVSIFGGDVLHLETADFFSFLQKRYFSSLVMR